MIEPRADRLFNIIIMILLISMLAIVIYPLYFIVLASVSDPVYVNSGEFLIYPKGFQLKGYINVIQDSRIWSGYLNTIFYTISGTLLGVITVLMAGYALSRGDLPFRGFFTGIFVFTMYFGGGLIPVYITVRNLGLIDKRAAIIILGSFSVYNMIIARTYFSTSLSVELREAAFIDGCSNQRFFISIAVPLSKPIIVVLVIYCAVSQWNGFFNALIYLNDRTKYPLQLVLREILLTFSALAGGVSVMSGMNDEELDLMRELTEIIKYSVIIVSTLPILCIYPFLQKYFVKGVMIGAIKG